ncbi:MAG: substrate-binding domain-containing protein [Desulfovibrionales bacterium]
MKQRLLSTKEVSAFLGVNEKMIYTLIAEKGLPATKITGKWLFPSHLVEQWVESNTINYPEQIQTSTMPGDLFVIAGSNDILLDRTIALFMQRYPEKVVVFGNLGSMGGLRALRRGLCQVATSHLMQENGAEFNFSYAADELDRMPAVVNFCRREQGFLLAGGNPKGFSRTEDIASKGLRLVNRRLGTGTRHMLDRELAKAGIDGSAITGYDNEVGRHIDVGLEILSGRADVGPGIRTVAGLLGLDFVPLQWERFDLLILKDTFFSPIVQNFCNLFHDQEFHTAAETLQGYDTSLSGRMIYPGEGATAGVQAL